MTDIAFQPSQQLILNQIHIWTPFAIFLLIASLFIIGILGIHIMVDSMLCYQ